MADLEQPEPGIATEAEAASTYPMATNISLSGPFGAEEEATQFAYKLIGIFSHLGKHIDLSKIDGVTVSSQYREALADLDRGMEGLRPLQASSEEDGVIGVAMAPAVIRDGVVKTHLVFDINYIWWASDPDSELFSLAIHTLAHECAHVEVTATLDRAFPGLRMRQRYEDFIEQFRGEVIDACFEEYAVTRICAGMGSNPIAGYRQTFVTSLESTDAAADAAVTAYRTHADLDQVMAQVPPLYGNLIKWASYLIGTMHGLGIKVSDQEELAAALSDHWFAEHFEKLEAAYEALWSRWGEWSDKSEFSVLGDIAIDALDHGGLILTKQENGGVHVDIPFRPNNTPGFTFNPFRV